MESVPVNIASQNNGLVTDLWAKLRLGVIGREHGANRCIVVGRGANEFSVTLEHWLQCNACIRVYL